VYKRPFPFIGNGCVRHINLITLPIRIPPPFIFRGRLAEESQLVAIPVAIGFVDEMARDIPPFCFESGMIAMVSRKNKLVTLPGHPKTIRSVFRRLPE
jgi:hypothetical protein